MPATARSVHSSTRTAGRPESTERATRRPQLHVVRGRRPESDGLAGRFGRIIEWTRTRTTPLLHVTIAVAFLVATLLGALMLRTQMVQDSFEANKVKEQIATLTQDVQNDQARLDELEASLPDKAQQMGMVPQQGSITIDLNGYQPSGGGQ